MRFVRASYYLPRSGEDMAKIEAIAPAVEKIVELRGTLEKPVHNIRFEGITFEHGSWLLPSEIGFVDLQAISFWIGNVPTTPRTLILTRSKAPAI